MQEPSRAQWFRDVYEKHWGKFWIAEAFVLLFVGFIIAWNLKGTPAAGTAEVGGDSHARHASAPTIWTCAMHPQIQLPHPGKCPICGMKLVPVSKLDGEEPTSLRQITISPESKSLMNIQTARVERRFVTAEIRMVGKVDYDETRLGFITAWVPGRLDRLFVDFTGVEIKKGDHMVELYSPEVYAAQEELILAAKAAQRGGFGSLAGSDTNLLESAREKLRLWGMTPEQVQEIEKRNRPSDHITIYAPMGGVVIHKNLQEGDYVKVGERIYTLADLSQVWVRLDAYESDLPWLHYGQRVTFTTEAYPGQTFEGQIVFIDPVLNPKTRTVKVRVNVPNPDLKLKPEMFVRGIVRAQVATNDRVMDPKLVGKWISPMHPEIIKDGPGICDICGMPLVPVEEYGYVPADAGAMTKPLVIPVSAPLVTGTRAIVYVEVPDTEKPTYEGREIVLGPRAGKFYIVHSGLSEGEEVVTNGNFKIDSALQIQAKPSTMTPEGGGENASQQSNQGRIRIPLATQKELKALDNAFTSISDAVQTGDLDRIRATFNALETDLQAVDADTLTGHTAMLWKELSMLLANDVVEGSSAKRPEDAYRVFNETAQHMRRVRLQLLHEASSPERRQHRRFDTPETFQGQLAKLWDAYQQVSAALASDDLPAVKKAVNLASQVLRSVDMRLLKGEAHDAWMAYSKELDIVLAELRAANDLAVLRAHFQPFSNQMASVILALGVGPSNPVYRLHCPMALDNHGARWLQASDEVHNPYLGTRMPKCGDEIELIAGRVTSKQEAHQHDE